MKVLSTIIFMLFTVNLSFSQISVVEAFPNLSFLRPIDLQHAPDNTDRIFVVSQRGDIDVFPTADTTISETKLFFSIKGSVRTGNEQGLLGLTFHPDYKNNGYFYVSYNPTDSPNRSVIARYKVSSNPDSADQSTKTIIIEIEQPFGNHNGGQIAFGPHDGYLYFGLGDGGDRDDREFGHGQNRKTLLGSMLRINVDDTSSYGNYAIPDDNPFVGNDSSYREEIYAWGLRNPWRWSFDPITGWLWLGDVGQGKWEEVDIIEKGKNYGWNTMEGAHCFPIGSECNDSGLVYPIAEYNHDDGIAITGGHVYRGSKVPDLYGKYIYADYGSGMVWTCKYDGINEPENEFLLSSGVNVSAFGIDKDYELYFCGLGGKIYKFSQPIQVVSLDSPTLISPINNSDSVATDTVLFIWTKVDSAENYLLEIASENTFAAEYYSITTEDTFANVPLNASAGVDFFWHVKALSETDSSDWSETWKFTTEQITGLDEKDVRPSSFKLMQNYPNPFNPSTKINYQLSENSLVNLKVYDLNGKEVQTLVRTNQNAGNYSVSFDASSLPSGIYFYKLSTSSGFSQSRKMILLK